MLFYNDLIMPQGEYTYSANVQFDIVDDKKLMRFIPNEMSIELLKQYFVDIIKEQPSHHARILYGSYGTGKSHFLTVLSLLLGKTHVDGVAFNTFLNRVSKLDDGLSNDIKSFVCNKEKKPFLIVPIVFDFEDFDRCICFSLKKALEQTGVNITFKNYYAQALNLVEKWCDKSDSEKRLKDACKKSDITISSLKKNLSSYNSTVVETFNRIFSEMTYGVPFIYETSNLADSIKQAYSAVSDKYSGFVFIFDEFGRYIEDNIKQIKVKQIQDLAEYCDHGDGNNHIILVSHKEISLYTSKYGDNIANEWKKVEGRYTPTPINDKQDQCLSLISNVLDKNQDVWIGFKSKFSNELEALYNSASDFKGFLINRSEANPYEAAFPLHPITLFALDRLSKKVAQNERTFFTYLSSLEENSLNDFLTSHELDKFNFVGIDDIFDYFEPSIKSVQSSKAYDVYKDYINALDKGAFDPYENSIEVRVLKVLTIINIIEDTSALNANLETFLTVIDATKEDISNAILTMADKKIIKFFGTYNQYRFYESSIYDIEELIKERINGIADESVSSVLNEYFVDFVLYPHSYNSEYKINRVFVPVYATTNDLEKNSFANGLSNGYDGTLVMLINSNGDEFNLAKNVLERSIVFVYKDTDALMKAVKEYIAILNLESTKDQYTANDPYFEKELAYCKNEQYQVVNKCIREWKNFQISEFEVYSDNKKMNVNSYKELCELASVICRKYYSKTLIVNNELINKNIISGSMRNARNKAVEAILNCEKSNYYGLQILSPEYLIVRSVLAKNGFLSEDADIEINHLENGYSATNDISAIFNEFFKKANNSFVEISELYNELKAAPYGLRDGYLPVIFAYMMQMHKSNLIISSHGKELELTVDLINDLVSRSKDYSLSIANWTDEELKFIDNLQKLFANNISQDALSKNRLKAIHDGMFSHYRLISKFSRTTQVYVSDVAKKYRKIMETTHKDYTKFIFGSIANLSDDGDLRTTFRVIKTVKSVLESSLNNLIEDVILNIKMVMQWDSEKSLSKLLINEYEGEWKSKRQKSFDFLTNSFLDYVSKLKKSSKDVDVLNSLAVILTGFECEYWSDKHRDEFIAKLTQIKATLDKYELSDDLSDSEMQVSLITSDGVERKVRFDKKDLSPLGETMKNKIGQTLDNFGMAVPYDDKVQIVLSVLEELIEGK